jgi:hypothetical protein
VLVVAFNGNLSVSSFRCETCNRLCLDTYLGYLTGCDHHPPTIFAIQTRLREEAAYLLQMTPQIVEMQGAWAYLEGLTYERPPNWGLIDLVIRKMRFCHQHARYPLDDEVLKRDFVTPVDGTILGDDYVSL